jgi:hypothetical protein
MDIITIMNIKEDISLKITIIKEDMEIIKIRFIIIIKIISFLIIILLETTIITNTITIISFQIRDSFNHQIIRSPIINIKITNSQTIIQITLLIIK